MFQEIAYFLYCNFPELNRYTHISGEGTEKNPMPFDTGFIM